ncbi:hypothetical protein [White-tailed deer poxvirus]|nr:hypothetical protein [White-tailed deer poxvirus]
MYINNNLDKITVNIFKNNCFSDILDSLSDIIKSNDDAWDHSKIYNVYEEGEHIDIYKRKSKQFIIENNDIIEYIRHTLLNEFSNNKIIEKIIVDKHITFVKYDCGDYFDNHTDFVQLRSQDCAEYHLILYVQKPKNGGKTKIFLNDDTSISTKENVLFDKTLVHKSTPVKEGIKIVALINVIIKYKIADDILFTIPYLDRLITFHKSESNKDLCYCYIIINNHLAEVDNFGIILDRSGRCLLVNLYSKVIKKRIVDESFDDMCMEVAFNYQDIKEYFYYLRNEDNKNIAWNTLSKVNKDMWCPMNNNDYTFLEEIVKHVTDKIINENINYYVLSGDCNSEIHYINFKIVKCYFSI